MALPFWQAMKQSGQQTKNMACSEFHQIREKKQTNKQKLAGTKTMLGLEKFGWMEQQSTIPPARKGAVAR